MSATANHPHHLTGPAKPAAAIDPAWLTVSRDLAGLLPALVGRHDLIVVAAPGAGHGAPGCHIPSQARIELNTSIFGGIDPATIRAHDPADHHRYPVAMGVLVHEAAHAAHTLWKPTRPWPGLVYRAAMLLEEIRIESAQVQRRPTDRHWLQAASIALDVAGAPATPAAYALQDLWRAAAAACGLGGRVDAGVLSAGHVAAAQAGLRAALTVPLFTKLRRIWRRALKTGDRNTRGMKALAERWCKLLTGPQAKQLASAPGNQQLLADATAAAAAAVEAAASHAQQDSKQQSSIPGAGTSTAAATAASVFVRRPPLSHTRAATDGERIAAARLGRALKRAAQHDRPTITVSSPTPPGRLNMRAARTADGQRARGEMVTAAPWRRTIKKHIPQSRPRVGIACDISGSMKRFLDPVAAAAWICAHATIHAGGTAAAATFAQHAAGLIPPGQRPARITVPGTERATDHLDIVIAALSNAVSLDKAGNDARLLVMVTDGYLHHQQFAAVNTAVASLIATGCAVIQLAPPDSNALQDAAHITVTDPASSIDIIAEHVVATLRNAARHGR